MSLWFVLILTVCGVGLITLGHVVISDRRMFRVLFGVIRSIDVKLGKIMSFVEVDQAALDAIATNLGEIVFALQTEIDSLKVALPAADLSGIQSQVTKLAALETPAATPAVDPAPVAPVADPVPAAPVVADPAPAAPVVPAPVVADPAPVAAPVVDPAAPVAVDPAPVAVPAPVVDAAAPAAAPVDPAAPAV